MIIEHDQDLFFLFIPIYSDFTREENCKKRTIDLKFIKKSIIRERNFNFSLLLQEFYNTQYSMCCRIL